MLVTTVINGWDTRLSHKLCGRVGKTTDFGTITNLHALGAFLRAILTPTE